jgi:hypothetical protein
MLPATVTQQRGVPAVLLHVMLSAPAYQARTSISNRSKKRLRQARFGKSLGLSLTKKWHAPVIVPISGSLRGQDSLLCPFVASLSARHSAACIDRGRRLHSDNWRMPLYPRRLRAIGVGSSTHRGFQGDAIAKRGSAAAAKLHPSIRMIWRRKEPKSPDVEPTTPPSGAV